MWHNTTQIDVMYSHRTRYEVAIGDTLAPMVFFSGHPAKFQSLFFVCVCVHVGIVCTGSCTPWLFFIYLCHLFSMYPTFMNGNSKSSYGSDVVTTFMSTKARQWFEWFHETSNAGVNDNHLGSQIYTTDWHVHLLRCSFVDGGLNVYYSIVFHRNVSTNNIKIRSVNATYLS